LARYEKRRKKIHFCNEFARKALLLRLIFLKQNPRSNEKNSVQSVFEPLGGSFNGSITKQSVKI
jgi:hypothetical protein